MGGETAAAAVVFGVIYSFGAHNGSPASRAAALLSVGWGVLLEAAEPLL